MLARVKFKEARLIGKSVCKYMREMSEVVGTIGGESVGHVEERDVRMLDDKGTVLMRVILHFAALSLYFTASIVRLDAIVVSHR